MTDIDDRAYTCTSCGWSAESDEPEFQRWDRAWQILKKSGRVPPFSIPCPTCNENTVVEVVR